MNDILTAEEFFEQGGTYPELAIKFAKLHVQKALKEASEKVGMQVSPYDMEAWEVVPEIITDKDLLEFFIEDENGDCTRDGFEIQVNKDSILNAYSLDKIK